MIKIESVPSITQNWLGWAGLDLMEQIPAKWTGSVDRKQVLR